MKKHYILLAILICLTSIVVTAQPGNGNGNGNGIGQGNGNSGNNGGGNNGSGASGFSCPANKTINCTSPILPSVTGSPVVGSGYATPTYLDEIVRPSCPRIINRIWSSVSPAGAAVHCVQTITVQDATPPQITVLNNGVLNCESATGLQITTIDCDPNPTINVVVIDSTWSSSAPCDGGAMRTQTQGGWGAVPHGNNNGVYLHAHFSQAFPQGLTIGCNNTITFTSAQSITDFLPSGSTPSALPTGAMVNPGSTYHNVLAGQLVAATLNVGFDAANTSFGASTTQLGQMIITSGPFQGQTVNQMMAIANQIIGGCNTSYSYSQVNEALTALNENYDNGNVNQGFLECAEAVDCALIITYQITATDNCGNVAVVNSQVTLIDNEAPVFPTMPASIVVNCDAIPPATIDFSGDCFPSEITIVVDESLYSGYCLPTIQRIFTATDQCGNTSSFTQLIAVIDTVAPVFANLPAMIQLECGDIIPDMNVTATDNCDPAPVVTFNETDEVTNCVHVLHRTWVATDHCGNTSQFQQIITIADHTGPQFSGQSTFQFSCVIGDVPVPTVEDNCGIVVDFSFTDVQTGSNCSVQIIRTWTATDNCGNASNFVQTIAIVDSEAPVFEFIPANLVLSCGAIVPDDQAVAVDNCGSVDMTMNEEIQSENNGCSTLIRTWVATDACANSSIAIQMIQFTDGIAPVLSSLPQSVSGNCDALTAAQVITATDNCDYNVEVIFNEDTQVEGCTVIVTRTWSAVDQCGNITTHSQLFSLTDDAAPAFNAAAEINVNCNAFAMLTIDVSDACHNDVSITFNDVMITTGCNRDIQRTWYASDPCGNTSSFQQLIHVSDNQAPVFTYVPANLQLDCTSPIFIEQPVVTDNCSMNIVPVLSEQMTGNNCNTVITRTWIATDDCGNISTASQIITIIDNGAPVISGVPQDVTISCSAYAYPPVPTEIFATDNCSIQPTLQLSETQVPGPCPSTFDIIRTWTATDDCGNSTSDGYIIHVIDNIPPVFTSVPTNITVTCGQLPPPFEVTASDNCSATVITMQTQNITGGCPHIFRIWTATDACGNSSMFTQEISIIDTEPPVISGVPQVGPTTCNNVPPIPDPIVVDNCDNNVQVIFSQTMIGTGCEFTLIRTWIAEDDCGNSSVVSQSIILHDDAPPVFAQAPPEVTVQCNGLNTVLPPNVIDDCAGTVITTYNDVTLGTGCSYIVERTYTAIDMCGNAAQATQIIHVVDELNPVLSGLPYNTYVQCGQIPAPANVTANDNCSGPLSVEFTEQIIGGDCNFQIVRVWRAFDDCGNVGIGTQTIYVSDSTAPTFTNVPANLQLTCNDMIPIPANPVATDACAGSNVNVFYFEFSESTSCGSIITRSWMASDPCGNSVTASHTITISDNTPPTFTSTPVASVNVTCDAIPSVFNAQAIDACSNVIISFSQNVTSGACPYTIQRRWTATDACGNASQFIQNITVSDVVAPILQNVPSDITLNCGDDFPSSNVTATDNCSANVQVQFSESSVWIGCTQTTTRTWSAVDNCGNIAVAMQLITMSDNEMPIFLSSLDDITVECNAVPMAQMPMVGDCSSFTIEMQENIDATNCASVYIINRLFIATDVCGNQNVQVQVINVEDHTAPTLSQLPADMTVTCSDIPSIPNIVAMDNCDNDASVIFTQEIANGVQADSTCSLQTAESAFGPIALWLPGLSGLTINYVFGAADGMFVRDDAHGTAHITGQVFNSVNPAQSWMIDFHLVQKRNWTQWSALGRSYKDDMNLAGNSFIDWTYYELDPSSTLTGAGSLEGSVLYLTHAPTNFYYGFQLGQAANNRNDAYGISGWFDYNGTVNGNSVSGHGDINTNMECCQEQMIVRRWVVQDCAGNTTIHTQTINVTHQTIAPMQQLNVPRSAIMMDISSNSIDQFTIDFSVMEEGRVTIDLYDMTGKMIENVYNGIPEVDTNYKISHSKSGMNNGLYFFHITNGRSHLSKNALMMK